MSKQKIPPPNYTQVPNLILDLLKDMSETEAKVTLMIARKTFGWHKEKEKLSTSELESITGMSRSSVRKGVAEGIKRGTVVREPSGDSYVYSLSIAEPEGGSDFNPPLGQNLTPPRSKFNPPLGQNLTPSCKEEKKGLKKHLKETHTQTKLSQAKSSVCVEEKSGSEFSLDEREMYAEVFKLGEGWLIKSVDGRYDHSMQKWFNKQIEQTIADSKAKSKMCAGCGVQTETPCSDDPAICALAPLQTANQNSNEEQT